METGVTREEVTEVGVEEEEEGEEAVGVEETIAAGVAEMMVAGEVGMKEEEEGEDMGEEVAEAEAVEAVAMETEEALLDKKIFVNQQLVRIITSSF